MKKFALLFVVVVFSFGFVGCVSSGNTWSKGLKDNREATVCGKEIVQVPSPDNPGMTQSEYRIQLTWHDVERGTQPVYWSVVSEEAYQMMNFSDKVTLASCGFGQMKGHVTVTYYWADDRVSGIYEFKYEFDLPEDPYSR